jgi:hypothetical protein
MVPFAVSAVQLAISDLPVQIRAAGISQFPTAYLNFQRRLRSVTRLPRYAVCRLGAKPPNRRDRRVAPRRLACWPFANTRHLVANAPRRIWREKPRRLCSWRAGLEGAPTVEEVLLHSMGLFGRTFFYAFDIKAEGIFYFPHHPHNRCGSREPSCAGVTALGPVQASCKFRLRDNSFGAPSSAWPSAARQVEIFMPKTSNERS